MRCTVFNNSASILSGFSSDIEVTTLLRVLFKVSLRAFFCVHGRHCMRNGQCQEFKKKLGYHMVRKANMRNFVFHK